MVPQRGFSCVSSLSNHHLFENKWLEFLIWKRVEILAVGSFVTSLRSVLPIWGMSLPRTDGEFRLHAVSISKSQ